MQTPLIYVTVVAVIIVGFFGGVKVHDWKVRQQTETPIAGAFVPAGGLTYRLQSSIGTSNSTLTLSSFKNRSSIPLTMTLLNTDIGYATIDPQTSRSEFVSFTGVTQNSDGTATLTGVSRGLADIYPFTASTTMTQTHAGQSILILSDSPQLFNEYALRRGNENISGTWNFQSLPTTTIACLSGSQFCNKAYIDAGLNQGAATSTFSNIGLVELALSSELAAGTASSSASGPLIAAAKFATSTPGALCTGSVWNCWPVANLSGKISQLWLDLTASFTFSGGVTSSGGLTSSATTTLTCSNVNSNACKFNTLAYAFPSARAASSTTLWEDGSGNLAFDYPDWQVLGDITATGATGTITVTIPARKDLLVVVSTEGFAVADTLSLRFNGDSGSNYGATYSLDYGVPTKNGGGTSAMTIEASPTSTTSPTYATINVKNVSSVRKNVIWNTTASDATTHAPVTTLGSGIWNNTSAAVTSVLIFGSGGQNLNAGSRVTVFGKRN